MTALACRNEYQVGQTVNRFYSDERRLLGRRLKRLKRMLDGGVPWVRAFEMTGIFRGSYERWLLDWSRDSESCERRRLI